MVYCKISEDRTYEEQEKYIVEHFGQHAADHANYGWFVDDIDKFVCTKVYGHGVLTTNRRTGEHTFEDF